MYRYLNLVAFVVCLISCGSRSTNISVVCTFLGPLYRICGPGEPYTRILNLRFCAENASSESVARVVSLNAFDHLDVIRDCLEMHFGGWRNQRNKKLYKMSQDVGKVSKTQLWVLFRQSARSHADFNACFDVM